MLRPDLLLEPTVIDFFKVALIDNNEANPVFRSKLRELIFQLFYDPDTNRQYRGNPLLVDSQLYNAEARYEWYFARDQRIAIAGFYKRINKPIETYASVSANDVISSFVNAPRANLYGAEIESRKYFDVDSLVSGRRIVAIANYTYTKSKILVKPNDPAAAFASSAVLASNFIRNGVPLTGQSDHIGNLELGLEARDHLSQQTLLLTYASKRVTNRGATGQPDIYEYPGLHLDFVVREGVDIGKVKTELKLDIRNITGTKYQEYQESGANRIYYNQYKVGTSFFVSASVRY